MPPHMLSSLGLGNKVPLILPSNSGGSGRGFGFTRHRSGDSKSSRRSNKSQSQPPKARLVYRVVALDLDGTLLRSSKNPSEQTISDKTADYLRKLDGKKGVQVIICTGRPAPTVYQHVLKLNLARPIPVVCSNGARGLLMEPAHKVPQRHLRQKTQTALLERATGGVSSTREANNQGSRSSAMKEKMTIRELFSIPVPASTVKRAIQLSNALEFCVVQYYVGEKIYSNPTTEEHCELTELYSRLSGNERTVHVTDEFAHCQSALGLPSKLLVLCSRENQPELVEAFTEEFGTGEATLEPGWFFIEILHSDVCKGNGLQKMCEDFLFTPLAQVVAFGDGTNDTEFLKMAGRGICMKNGKDSVKEIADEVIDLTNNEEGVRKTLQRMEHDGLLFGTSRGSSHHHGNRKDVFRRSHFL